MKGIDLQRDDFIPGLDKWSAECYSLPYILVQLTKPKKKKKKNCIYFSNVNLKLEKILLCIVLYCA